jgi:hypothetical protein
LLCPKEELASVINLSGKFPRNPPDFRLAGEKFQKKQGSRHISSICDYISEPGTNLLVFSSVPSLQTMPGKSFSIHSSVREWLALRA